MRKYEKPNFEIENFEIIDIITASSAIDGIIGNTEESIQKSVNFDELNI